MARLQFEVNIAPSGSVEHGARGISLSLTTREHMPRLKASPPSIVLHVCGFGGRIKSVHFDGVEAEDPGVALQIAERSSVRGRGGVESAMSQHRARLCRLWGTCCGDGRKA